VRQWLQLLLRLKLLDRLAALVLSPRLHRNRLAARTH
jgi:hypothetical protein